MSDSDECPDNCEDESDEDDIVMSQKSQPTSTSVFGRDRTEWTSTPSTNPGRTGAHNVFKAATGVPRPTARDVSTPYDAWKHFIDESLRRMIAKFTTKEAARRGDNEFVLDLHHLETFIGLQYARGLYGKGHPACFLWSRKYGMPIFSEAMSRDSFIKILKYLRFDDKPNKIRRGPGADKFTPIREAFEKFSSLCRSKFVCDYSLTIDEQLMPCKSRCSFVTYMPNKPDKYGIKFWVLVDVKSKYVSNIFPYLGAQEKEQRGDTPLAESVVMTLTEGVRGKRYNITCDNFFTSLPLALKLQKEKISIVGTIRKNRREIAKKMTDAVKGNLHCSQFYWHKNNDMLFVKYQAKAKKTVCMLSSMHHSPDIDQSNVTQKPQVILFYNKNKVGVDCFDQMTRLYSTRSASRRWPLTVWGNILDIAAINARVIFMKSTGTQISRRNFLLKLIEELTAKQTTMQSRESSDRPICSVNSTRK